MEPDEVRKIGFRPRRKDFASTGWPGKVYPTLEMFRALAEDRDTELIKMSTRGESGGTIDILEHASNGQGLVPDG